MAATPYKPVTWGDEPTYKDKLNQMTNNDQWLYENAPRLNFNTYGIKRTSGVKIMAAIAVVRANKSLWTSTTFNFGTFFSSGCKPVIVTGTQPTGGKYRYHTIVKGIGSYYPDHRGVEVHVGADYYGTGTKNTVDTNVYVHFIAVGW
jgi:hypothetical protein